MNPKNDYVFARIFGYVGNEEITKGLIESIIDTKITSIELDKNLILERDLIDDKLGVLDIRAKLNEQINVDIELQVIDEKNIKKRILFYWSKLYNQGIQKSDNYKELKKVIVILISNYTLKNLIKIKKGLTKWNIREEEYYINGKIKLPFLEK